ncbi:MAG: hypothetical protein OXE78_01435 [Gammaproteobacteria bacterium]|nr:hypothetical protein [Gammaproteobacteria bacterium]
MDSLFDRFEKSTHNLFYEFLLVQIIRHRGQPSIAEIRTEIAKISAGKLVRSEASDKQLIGRMDKRFGLLEFVDGKGIGRRFRLNTKGMRLLERCEREVIRPLVSQLTN